MLASDAGALTWLPHSVETDGTKGMPWAVVEGRVALSLMLARVGVEFFTCGTMQLRPAVLEVVQIPRQTRGCAAEHFLL